MRLWDTFIKNVIFAFDRVMGWLREQLWWQDFQHAWKAPISLDKQIEATDDPAILAYLNLRAPADERAKILTKMRTVGGPEYSDTIKGMERALENERKLNTFMENPSAELAKLLHEAEKSPVVREIAEITGTLIVDSFMEATVGGMSKLDPDLAERFRNFIGVIATKGVAPRYFGTMLELTTGGAIDSGGDFFRDAYFNLGLGFITWQLTSPMLKAGLADELTRNVLRIFRPTKFTWSQLRDLKALGEVGDAEMIDTLADQGYSDADIARMLKTAYRGLSMSMALDAWRLGLRDRAWVEKQIRAQGYAPEDIALILELEAPEEIVEKQKVYISTIRKAYKEHLIGENEFRGILVGQNYDADMIDLEIELIKLGWIEADRELTQGQVRSAYMESIIGDTEAEHHLATAGFDPGQIGIIIDTWRKQKEPPVRKLNQSVVMSAYAANVIDRNKALALLATLGYQPDAAGVIMDTADIIRVEKPRIPAVTTLMAGVSKGLITLEEFTARLIELGYSDPDVALYVRLITFPLPEKGRDLTRADVLAAFKEWIISYEETYLRLLALGYGTDDTVTLLKTRIRQRSGKEIVEAYLKGYITCMVMLQYFAEIGMDVDEAKDWIAHVKKEGKPCLIENWETYYRALRGE